MPAYDYRCDHCGKFELEQKISDHPLVKCPKCGRPVKRLISGAGIIFKGSGFHITDYGKKPVKPENKSPAGTNDKPANK